MKRILIILCLFSSSIFAEDTSTNYVPGTNVVLACRHAYTAAAPAGLSGPGCGYAGTYYFYHTYSVEGNPRKGQGCGAGSSGCSIHTHAISSCPDFDPVTGQCIEVTPPGNDDVVTGSTKPGDPVDDTVVDQDGNVWEQKREIVDPFSGKAQGQWEPTGETVDPADESTWPEGAISSGDDLFAPGALDEDGFHNEGVDPFTPGVNNPSYSDGGLDIPTTVTDTDTSTTTDPNSTTTKDTTTKILPDGDIERKTIETTNNSDGSSTQETTTSTKSSTNGTTTTTVVRTETDSQGATTTTLTGSETTEGEDTAEGSASSAGNCSAPPPCTGDPIGCAILVQEWKTGCNAYETATGAPDCQQSPTCEGDPIECAILKQDWDQFCNTQDSLDNLATDAESHFTSQGLSDLDTLAPGELGELLSDGEGDLDVQSELGNFFNFTASGGTCPQPETANLGQFGTVEFSYDLFCDLANIIRYVVLLGAYFVGGNVVLRSFTS